MRALTLLLLLCLPVDASVHVSAPVRDAKLKPGDVYIPPEFRIRNRNGNCVWTASECICLQAGYESFRGITDRAVERGWHGAGMSNVEAAFKAANIPYKSTRKGDYSLLYEGVKNGSGVYVEIPGHALVVVGIDEKSVRLIDNGSDRSVKEWSRAHFGSQWEGCGIFPIFRRRPFNRPTPGPSEPHPPLNPAHPVEPPPELIVQPKEPEKVPPLRPKDPDVELLKRLDAIIKQNEQLAKEVAELKARPMVPGKDGSKGDKGEPGTKGEPGKDADPARLAALEQAMREMKFQAILLDESGRQIQTVEFGPNMPLKLKLKPVP